MLITFGYSALDRVRLWEAAPLAQNQNWFESVLAHLGIPEVMSIIAVGLIVYFVLDAIGHSNIGKMAIVVAVFNSAAVFLQHLGDIFKGA